MSKKKKSPTLAARAWRLLRLALLCKRRLVEHIRLALAGLKCLCDNQHRHSYRLHYGEHELSFGDTPTFQFMAKRRRRSFLSCIDPPLVSFDDDDDDEDSKEEEEHVIMDGGSCRGDETVGGGEESVDAKADEFISRFYEEMKLQRQLSYQKYNEMIRRGAN